MFVPPGVLLADDPEDDALPFLCEPFSAVPGNDRLAFVGVDFAQGYGIHRPEPLQASVAS